MVAQSTTCGRPNPYNNCGTYKNDSVYLNMAVTNQAATFTLADTIKVFSKISDTISPIMSSGFVYPLSSVVANVLIYKLVPVGNSYQLNYANIEFNVQVQTGLFQNSQYLGYNLLFNRNQPFNNLQFTLKPGVPGLYVVVVNKSDYDYGATIRNPNDNCVNFKNIFRFKDAEQNLQYWNTLGLTTLTLSSSSNYIVVSKNDKNYFFIKVI